MATCELGTISLTGATWLAEAVSSLHGAYAHVHPYMAVALCLIGTMMNIVTVVVLTRPTMLSSVNILLCAVALCDIIVMSSVLIFVSHFLISAQNRCIVEDYSRWWAYFLFLHAQATVIFHGTSIWLTVLLAQIRVFTIKRVTTGPAEAITTRMTGIIAVSTLIFVAVINIPNFLTFEIVEIDAGLWLPCLAPDPPMEVEVTESSAEDYTSMVVNASNISLDSSIIYHVRPSEEDCGLLKIAYWTNGLLFKVVPCVLLTFSIVALLRIIKDVSKRRKSLAQVMNKRKMPRDHTTPMLVAVLSIFLIAELPQGILHVCNAIYTNETFYNRIYLPLGDVMDLLSLLNSAVNFVIYCAMSRKFRCVFLQLVFSCLPQRLYRKYIQDWSGLNELEISRHKPSGMTDLTRTEQLALTSHRVSATSMLIRTSSRENLFQTKSYPSNYLSANDLPSSNHSESRLTCPRVSFDQHTKPFDGRSSLEIHEIRLPVPNIHKQPSRSLLEMLNSVGHRLFNKTPQVVENSPQRRLNMIQYETGAAGY